MMIISIMNQYRFSLVNRFYLKDWFSNLLGFIENQYKIVIVTIKSPCYVSFTKYSIDNRGEIWLGIKGQEKYVIATLFHELGHHINEDFNKNLKTKHDKIMVEVKATANAVILMEDFGFKLDSAIKNYFLQGLKNHCIMCGVDSVYYCDFLMSIMN